MLSFIKITATCFCLLGVSTAKQLKVGTNIWVDDSIGAVKGSGRRLVTRRVLPHYKDFSGLRQTKPATATQTTTATKPATNFVSSKHFSTLRNRLEHGPGLHDSIKLGEPIDLNLCKSDADCAGDWICVGIGICVPPAKDPKKPEDDSGDDDDDKKKKVSFGNKGRSRALAGRPSGYRVRFTPTSEPIDLDLCKSDADCAGDWICVGIGICVPPAKEPKTPKDDSGDDDKKQPKTGNLRGGRR